MVDQMVARSKSPEPNVGFIDPNELSESRCIASDDPHLTR